MMTSHDNCGFPWESTFLYEVDRFHGALYYMVFPIAAFKNIVKDPPSVVVIRAPNGKSWRCELKGSVMSGSCVAIARDLGLNVGYVVVFRWEKPSMLHIESVYDDSGQYVPFPSSDTGSVSERLLQRRRYGFGEASRSTPSEALQYAQVTSQLPRRTRVVVGVDDATGYDMFTSIAGQGTVNAGYLVIPSAIHKSLATDPNRAIIRCEQVGASWPLKIRKSGTLRSFQSSEVKKIVAELNIEIGDKVELLKVRESPLLEFVIRVVKVHEDVPLQS